ncbi:MAG TPA: PQQ-like beta-propeller repeat protein [Dehalococcoidia bacterium]|nr:PQQ-like beta-propeller repeat protein [Dehalococcoidia bacterium]
MDSSPEKPEAESREVKQWLVCPVCKQPNPVGTPHCQHCWGASLHSVEPITTEELETIMAQEQARARQRNLRKVISVSIVAPLLLFAAVFLSIYSLTDVIFAPSPTINSSPAEGEWSMFRHDLSHSGSINHGTTQPQGELKWSFFPLEEEMAAVQAAVYTMMAEEGLTSVLATDRTHSMTAFPALAPIYPDYLDIAKTRGRYSCNSEGLVRLESGIHSSPTVVDGIVYFGSQDWTFYAVDADTGTKLWEFRANSFVDSSPAVVDGIVYFGSNDSYFYALDAETGTKLWSFYTGKVNQTSPAVADGMVFFGSDNSMFYALDAKTGEKIWEYRTDGPIISSPAVVNGIVYFSTFKRYFYALQASNGRFRLQVRIHETASSPAFKDGVVYINSNGSLFAIDSEARNWPGEYDLHGLWLQLYAFRLAPVPPPMSGYLWNVPRLGRRTSASSPVISDGTIYTAHDRYLYAIDIETQERLWSVPFIAGDDLRSSPALGNDTLYIGSEDGLLYAVNVNNGQKLWHFVTGGPITSSPTLADGVIYVTSHDGRLYAIE